MAIPLRYEELDDLGILRVTGGDRQTFLQGQLTQDLLKLEPSRSLLAGWTNAKGRLLALCQLFARQEEILLLLPRELLASVAQRLSMFVLRADVRIEATEQSVFGLLDLPVEAELALGGLELAQTPGACASSPELLLARSLADSDRALAIGSKSHLEPLLAAAGQRAAPGSWQQAEIAAGLPGIFLTTSEAFVPQMLNLDLLGAISFTKGCYVGQEVVARTQNLGRIKRRMFRFRVPGAEPLQAGDALLNQAGDSAGRVVSSAAVSDARELLAVVPLSQPRDQLYSADGRQLELLALPYAVPNPD